MESTTIETAAPSRRAALFGGLALLVTGACGDDGGGPAAADAAPVADAAATPDAESSEPDAAGEADADVPGVPEMLLHYEFEDLGAVVTDSAERELHGMLSDISAWTTEGRIDNGLALTADATRYVDLPSGVFEGVDDFTIAVWVKYDTIQPWSRVYDIGNGLADPDNRFMYLTPSGADGVHAASYGGSPENESVILAGTQLPTGVWKHVALTGSGGDRTLYVDGYPVAEVVGGPEVPPSEMEPIGGASWLGKSRFGVDPGFDGTMDDFRVYSRVLSQAEIADLAWPQQDYSYWRFDEGAGTSAADSSDRAVPTALVDGAGWAADGRLGAAVDLSGAPAGATGPHVAMSANPLAGCTDELTIAAWVKLRSLDNWARVFDFGGAESFIYLAPTDGAGTHFAMVAPGKAPFDTISAAPLIAADEAWHHVAVTVAAGGAVTIYVDGAVGHEAVSAEVSPGDLGALTNVWLGKSRFPDPYLNGSIDELRVSCRAYTADEITNLAHP